MRLSELDPHWIRYETRVETYDIVDGDEATWRERGCPTKKQIGPRQYTLRVDTFSEAQGVEFLCPICLEKDRHTVAVSFEGRSVLPEQGCHNSQGQPTRWNVSGDTFENLTTTPSILIEGGCNWHGFITAGEVT